MPEVPDLGSSDRVVVFGPNGAGKTTLLRQMSAAAQKGAAYLPQRPYLFRGPARRNLHMSLDQDGRARADQLAERLGVGGLLDRSSRALSGGEVQRIALARVLAVAAPMVLLDEPLAPLDVKDRQMVADVIADEVAGRRAVIVTHDHATVATLADSVAVMIDGEIRQVGDVGEVFALPADDDVAAAVGIGNALAGVVAAHDGALVRVDVAGVPMWALGTQSAGTPVRVMFRAEAVTLLRGSERESSARNEWLGTIDVVRAAGALVEVLVDIGVEVAALLTPGSVDALDVTPGTDITLSVKATAIQAVTRS